MSEETQPFILDLIMALKEKMGQDEPFSTLIDADILLKTIEPEWINKHGFQNLQSDIDNFLVNQTHNRMIRLNSAIKKDPDLYVELLGRDIGKDDRLFYREEFEKDLILLMLDIRKFMALIIKTRMGDSFNLT
jgi:hypothetical protein